MKDFKTILLILLAVMLMLTWGFYIYEKSSSPEPANRSAITDSTGFKKAVMQVLEDSLRKIYASALHDTVFIATDSLSALKRDSLEKSTGLDKSDSKSYEPPARTVRKPKLRNVKASQDFHAGGINLTAITSSRTSKPEVTSFAKDAEKFILSFNLQNSGLPTGNYTLYIIVTGPDNKVIKTATSGKDFFAAGKEGWKSYTKKIQFFYVKNNRKTVTTILYPGSFSQGNYSVKVYQNGKMIGSSTTALQ